MRPSRVRRSPMAKVPIGGRDDDGQDEWPSQSCTRTSTRASRRSSRAASQRSGNRGWLVASRCDPMVGYGRGGRYAIRARALPRRSEKLRTRRGICHMTEVRPRESVRRCGWYSCRSLRGVLALENRLGRILAPAHVFRRHVLQMRCPEVTLIWPRKSWWPIDYRASAEFLVRIASRVAPSRPAPLVSRRAWSLRTVMCWRTGFMMKTSSLLTVKVGRSRLLRSAQVRHL